MKKFFNVEIIICFLDYTWTTDYVLVPFPPDEFDFDEAEFKEKAIEQWQKEEELKSEQRGIQPISYVGVYNVNWDEAFDADGEPIEEDENESNCYHCGKPVCFERSCRAKQPEEYEVCMGCDDHVCNDCVDWKFMRENDMETPICKRCAANNIGLPE